MPVPVLPLTGPHFFRLGSGKDAFNETVHFLQIKNFAVGRRNWLFARSIRDADASAVVYSITETALLNGLKPYVYLKYVLNQLRQTGSFPKSEELDRLNILVR